MCPRICPADKFTLSSACASCSEPPRARTLAASPPPSDRPPRGRSADPAQRPRRRRAQRRSGRRHRAGAPRGSGRHDAARRCEAGDEWLWAHRLQRDEAGEVRHRGHLHAPQFPPQPGLDPDQDPPPAPGDHAHRGRDEREPDLPQREDDRRLRLRLALRSRGDRGGDADPIDGRRAQPAGAEEHRSARRIAPPHQRRAAACPARRSARPALVHRRARRLRSARSPRGPPRRRLRPRGRSWRGRRRRS